MCISNEKPQQFLRGSSRKLSDRSDQKCAERGRSERQCPVLELIDVVGFGEQHEGGCTANFWSRWNHMTSAENVKFLTGVQRVTPRAAKRLARVAEKSAETTLPTHRLRNTHPGRGQIANSALVVDLA